MEVTLILVRFCFVMKSYIARKCKVPQQSTYAYALRTGRKSVNFRENNKKVNCLEEGTMHIHTLIKITSEGKGDMLAWL
jgi:hypothetical protein